MEDDTKRFLAKVVQSISVGILWLIINMTAGIYLGWLFFGDHMTTGNIIFYIWLVGSLVAMIVILARIWKEKFPIK
jgi:hypothetical protein